MALSLKSQIGRLYLPQTVQTESVDHCFTVCSAIQLRSHQLQRGGFISLPVPKLFEAKVESRPFLLHVSGSVQINCLMAGYTSLCLFANSSKRERRKQIIIFPSTSGSIQINCRLAASYKEKVDRIDHFFTVCGPVQFNSDQLPIGS